jgi:hypothetical protein
LFSLRERINNDFQNIDGNLRTKGGYPSLKKLFFFPEDKNFVQEKGVLI